MTIFNKQLTIEEMELLNFFISLIDSQNDEIINQINSSNITRERSPYHLILKFDISGSYAGSISDYKFDSTIQVLHKNSAPTVFIMFIKNGLVHEFEVFNGDLSCLDYSTLCDGEVFKEF